MLRHFALEKHHNHVAREFPVVAAMILVAGGTLALFLHQLWPMLWALSFVSVHALDNLITRSLIKAVHTQQTEEFVVELKLGLISALTVCAFLIVPIFMLTTWKPELVIGAMAMITAAATRTTAVFSVSRISGAIALSPFYIVPTIAILQHNHSDFGYIIACLSIALCLVYIWTAWRARDQAEQELDAARADAVIQRDAASRDAMISRLAFQHTTQRAVIFDTEGRFLAVNAAWIEASQLEEKDLLGRKIHEVDADAHPQWAEAVQKALQGVATRKVGDRRPNVDDKEIVLDWEVQPWRTADGSIGGAIGYAQDVTEIYLARAAEAAKQEQLGRMMARAQSTLAEKRKLLEVTNSQNELALGQSGLGPEADETALNQLNDEQSSVNLLSGFERILAEIDERDATLAAAINEMNIARKEAEAASIAKSQFLANMSHELRTPLNAITGYTEILIEDAEADGRRDSVSDANKVRTSAQHLLKLINEILDLSKIEAGRMQINKELTQLADVISDVVEAVKPVAKQKNNEIIVDLGTERNLAFTDGFRLRQCLMNLVSNACKFTENGRVKISLSAIYSETLSRSFRILVEDDGIGISENTLPHLFRPFQQADGSTTRKYGGTGLGLALTREIAHLLGGEIEVESYFGQGSKFAIIIPAFGLEALDVETIDGAESDASRILVIDDDPVARAFAVRAANGLGMAVASAETGRSALAYCEDNSVDLIILDLELPDMDGMDILAALRGNERTRHTPVLVVSINDDRRMSISAGAQDHIAKPCSTSVLASAIARLARRSSRALPSTRQDNKSKRTKHTDLQAELEKPLTSELTVKKRKRGV